MSNYKLQNYKTIHQEVKAIQFDGTEEMAEWIVQTFPCFSKYELIGSFYSFQVVESDPFAEDGPDFNFLVKDDYIVTDSRAEKVFFMTNQNFEKKYQMVHIVGEELAPFKDPDVKDGDIRRITLTVDCYFEYCDTIPSEIDDETGDVIETTTGYIMHILDKSQVWDGRDSIHIGSVCKET